MIFFNRKVFLNDNRIAFNTLAQLASRFLVVLISLFTTSLLTRHLGVEGYGNYVFVTSFILLFVSFSDLGTSTIGVRESSQNPSKTKETFGQVLFLRLIFTSTLLLLIYLLSRVLPQFVDLRQATIIASLVLPFLVLRTLSQAIFQVNLRLDLSSLLEISASVVFFTLSFWYFWTKGKNLEQIMLIWVISAFLSGLLGLVLSRKYTRISLCFDKQKLFRLFKESLPLGMSLLVYTVYDRGIDNFILKTYFSSQEIGYYGLAYKIHGNLILGAAFLLNSLFPLLCSKKASLDVFKNLFHKAFSFLFIAGALILVVGFFSSPFIIKTIAGSQFEPSVLALRILLLATFFSYLNHLTGYSLVALGKQAVLFRASLVGLSINLVLNLVFIPRFSFLAACVATIMTEATLFFLTYHFLRKKYNFFYNKRDLLLDVRSLFKDKQKYFES